MGCVCAVVVGESKWRDWDGRARLRLDGPIVRGWAAVQWPLYDEWAECSTQHCPAPSVICPSCTIGLLKQRPGSERTTHATSGLRRTRVLPQQPIQTLRFRASLPLNSTLRHTLPIANRTFLLTPLTHHHSRTSQNDDPKLSTDIGDR